MKFLTTSLLLAASMAFAQTPAKDTKKPAPAPKTSPAPAPKVETKVAPAVGGFLGNKDSKTLHKADCKIAAKMKAENKTSFATKAEAEKAGYKACKVCKP